MKNICRAFFLILAFGFHIVVYADNNIIQQKWLVKFVKLEKTEAPFSYEKLPEAMPLFAKYNLTNTEVDSLRNLKHQGRFRQEAGALVNGQGQSSNVVIIMDRQITKTIELEFPDKTDVISFQPLFSIQG